MLPECLPTDADELEALYENYVLHGQIDQAEFDRLMEARLRAWGYDPKHMTSAQMFSLMAESINRMMINLYGALDTAPDAESAEHVRVIVKQAETLRSQIAKVIDGEQNNQSANEE